MKIAIAAVIALLAGPAVAQQHQHRHGQSPYAGAEKRAIKALSDQQIADLRAGRGMGLALAAELNGYPGPVHVLELGDRLQLTQAQKEQVRQVYEAMKAEAVALGDKLLAGEQALDRAFAGQSIDSAGLASLTAEIAQLQGQLRAVHLKYHLTTRDLLSSEQRRRYAELRGYQ